MCVGIVFILMVEGYGFESRFLEVYLRNVRVYFNITYNGDVGSFTYAVVIKFIAPNIGI